MIFNKKNLKFERKKFFRYNISILKTNKYNLFAILY